MSLALLLISAALFLCVGVVYERMHSRLIKTYGGIVSVMPKYAVMFMIFTLAAIGLPGTSGFVGEFLILIGALLPVPFSITCVAAGMIKYPLKGVVLFGLFRFVRFALYAWAIFNVVN